MDSLVWTPGDFEDVAHEQERRVFGETAPLVVADNDAFAATVRGERYLGFRPHLYLLTGHAGVPFERELEARGVPWLKLTEDRFATAVDVIERLMRQDVTRGSRSRA